MTGVGAIFDLYASFKPDKKKKDEEEVVPEEEVIEGHVDEESDWHYVISKQEWDTVLDMLQNYDFKKFKPKEPDKKKKKQLRALGAAIWVKEKALGKPKPEEIPNSPLLALDVHARTPLHAAVRLLAPDRYILRMIFSERRATQLADEDGRLALHLACLHDRNIPVIDRLIRANFKDMQHLDNDGLTPLMVTVERAKAFQEEDGGNRAKANRAYWDLWGYWGIPRSREEAEWQERQEHIWAKVRFVLLSYSTRRKVLVEEERDVLLQALEHAAPPTVVEVIILAAQGMLHQDPSLAATALSIFMRREYPIKNLQLLLHHFPEKNYESMEAARKILSNHYRIGCRLLPKRTMTFREEMEKHTLEDNFKRSLPCQEWWDKVRCLLRLRGHGNNKEDKKAFKNQYLLHAALSNCDTAPSLVQLLMVMSPESIKLPHPFNNSLLIHLICRNWKYNLFPQSKMIGMEEEMEEPPMEQVMKIVVASDPTLARKRHNDRLPLHHGVATGKSIDFLDALLKVDRKALAIRDPQVRLYPFQMAALGNMNKNAGIWAAAKYTPMEWHALTAEDRAQSVDEVRDEQDHDQLSMIYFLLRKFPAAIASGAALRKPALFRDSKGKGMVSTHCLMMLYEREKGDRFALVKDKFTLLEETIQAGTIPEELETWWSKMKFWIRYCYHGDEDLPSGENYLLHAAAANEDTPPILVELLIALYPQSAALPVNGDTVFPLHLAAGTPPYKKQPFEVQDGKGLFEMLVEANPEAATIKSAQGLPVDIAQAAGRSEEEVEPLVQGAMRQFVMDMDEEIDLTGMDDAPGLLEESDDECSELTEPPI
jgi:hypothetical protein